MKNCYRDLPKVHRMSAIDHMRGFIFLLMAMDHALHAYAANWGKYAFFRDYDRSYTFDALYLFNQAAIMPVLFFTFGAYVLPKLSTYGVKMFWKDRFVKFIIPFMVGVPLIVPLLSFPRFHEFTDQNISYMDYWMGVFFTDKLQAGPYWVMYALVLYTLILLTINKLMPSFIGKCGNRLRQGFKRPVPALSAFFVLSAFIYGLSDLRYGAPWWVGFRDILPEYMYGQLFSLQGSKFMMNFVYFIMGAAFMKSQVWKSKEPWKDFLDKRYFWFVAMVTFGVLYTLYAHAYFHDGAYDYTIYKILRIGHGSADSWIEALNLVTEKAPRVLMRTTLMAALALMQFLTLLSFFGKNAGNSSGKFYAIWASATACCWGIFIIHDPIIIWMQFTFVNYHIPIIFKILIVSIGGIGVSWIMTHFILKIKGLRRIFELD